MDQLHLMFYQNDLNLIITDIDDFELVFSLNLPRWFASIPAGAPVAPSRWTWPASPFPSNWSWPIRRLVLMERLQWASSKAACFRDWLPWMNWSPKQTTAQRYVWKHECKGLIKGSRLNVPACVNCKEPLSWNLLETS